MDGNDHTCGLGMIIGNLHALEFCLRVFLCEAHSQQIEFPSDATMSVPETFISNWDSLGQLIDKYNASLSLSESHMSVDKAVVETRDAIAHGRLMASAEAFPLTLYKFGKPVAGRVPLAAAEVITKAWLGTNRIAVREQLAKVRQCGKVRGYSAVG
jgi:hypothetical protein